MPFVGKAGDVLYGALWRLGALPQAVYVTNAFKGDVFTREGKRRPTKPELDDHFDLLMHEIRAVQPRIILVLGDHATPVLLPRTRFRDVVGRIAMSPIAGVPVLPSYHPARVVRNLMTRVDFENGLRPFVTHKSSTEKRRRSP